MANNHFWLLIAWIVVGTWLRFHNLGELPPWTDEFATMVFSLGNSFYKVPLDQFINLSTLMEPLQLNANGNINDVAHLLQTESTHPPLYFMLTHLWLKLFPAADGLVSVWGARSLSAGLGVLAIPAVFGFVRLINSNLLMAQIAAGMMAVSPFGIFLALQARHYTLIILMILATLSCFMIAYRSLNQARVIPLWLVILWISINCLGVATHYFFVLTLAAMAIAFIPLLWRDGGQKRLLSPPWRQLYLVALGSLVGCLVWLPSLLAVRQSSPTDWIYASNATERWLEPLGRFLLWLMSTVIMLPSSLYDFPLWSVIVVGILTLLFWIWCSPPVVQGIKSHEQDSNIIPLVHYFWAAIALFFGLTYLGGMDLTLAGRFQFVYFPVVIVLIAAGLSSNLSSKHKTAGQKLVAVFLAVGLISGIVANMNRGYLQNHRPDLAIAKIVEGTKAPLAIATTYRHHGQTGRIMGLAWGLRNFSQIQSPQFFLASEIADDGQKSSPQFLSQQLTTVPRPLDLWLVNFKGDLELEQQNCLPDSQYRGILGQYKYRLYRCRE
ncbi:MAG: hypothetical protein AAFQ80_20335 [Cyanobacteria bacterium J06621_8]